MDQEELNLNELLDDIRRVKKAIKQNSYAVKEAIYLPMMKLIFLIAGLAALIIPTLYYFFIKSFGNYQAIPYEIRLLLIAAIIIGVILTGAGKMIFYFQARQHISRPSLIKILMRLFSRQVILMYPVLIGSMLFFILYFLFRQDYYLLVPTFAIGLGVIFSMIGSIVSFPEFFVLGNYFWIAGTISVPFLTVNPLASLLWVSGIFGLGMLLFSFYLLFFYRPEGEEDGKRA